MTKTNLWIWGIVILVVGFFIGYYTIKTSSVSILQSGKGTKVTAEANGMALWQFPDKRALNPKIFGTPKNPLDVARLPLFARDVNADGTAYTTTKKPLMFSNKTKKTTGSIKISVEDLTALDTPNSKDKATMVANFKGPGGKSFKVILRKLIPVGPVHPFFGGVGTNILMHGNTGIGTPLVTKEFSYITIWGVADLYENGKLVDTGRIIHMMVSQRTRDNNFKVGFKVANPNQLEIHLLLPPKKGSPTGPIDSPVPTGVVLPNNIEQPFIHVNFYGNIKMVGNQFVK